MTHSSGARLQPDTGRHNGPGRRSASPELMRLTDGRWAYAPQTAASGPPGAPPPPPSPATTELAVTKARDTRTDAEWAAVNEFDPAFEEASQRFFETDPGNRLTYTESADDDPGQNGGHHRPGHSFAPVQPGRIGDDGYAVDNGALAGYPEGPAPEYGPGGPDPDPYAAGEPADMAGAGYHVVYGDGIDDVVEPEVDDEALATGAAARRNAIEWAVVLVAAVLLALVLRALVLQAFYIPSPSMEETLLIQDRVLVNKLSYRFGDIGQGDIVVFHRTDEEIATAGPNQPKDVIKRVIALGGETVEIRENTVLVDGVAIDEPYLKPGIVMPDFGPLTVPEGSVFVMGDNRNLSSDSRGELGPVAEERVVGRAFVLFWPVNRVTGL